MARKTAAANLLANVTTTRAQLLDGLSLAARVTPKKSTHEPLMRVRLSYREHELRAFASDLFASVDTHIAGECDAPFDLCVQGRDLFDVARRCAEGPVTLEVGTVNLTVRSGVTHWSLPTTHSDEAPSPIGTEDSAREAKIDAGLLAGLLATVRPVVGEAADPHMHGVRVEMDHGHLRAIGVCKHMLAVVQSPIPMEHGGAPDIVIPAPTVDLLAHILPGQGEITLRIGRRTASFQAGATEVGMLLSDHQFPPYQKVIPKKHVHELHFDRDALASEIARVSLTRSDRLLLTFDMGRLELSWVYPQDGRSAAGSVECDYQGTRLMMGAATNYLLDALTASTEDDLWIGIAGEIDPITFRTKSATRETTAVVMPMRL